MRSRHFPKDWRQLRLVGLLTIAWAATLPAHAQLTDGQFLTGDFFAILGRAPDPNGWAFWYQSISGNRDAVTNGLLSSAEYYSRCSAALTDTDGTHVCPGPTCVLKVDPGQPDDGTPYPSSYSCSSNPGSSPPNLPANNSDFLTLLYWDALLRPPDSGGWLFWLPQLTSGSTKSSVVSAFVTSSEFATNYAVGAPVAPTGLSASSTGSVVTITATFNAPVPISSSNGLNIGSGQLFISANNPNVPSTNLGQGCYVEWSWSLSGGFSATSLNPSYCSLSAGSTFTQYSNVSGAVTLKLNYPSGIPPANQVWVYGANAWNWPTLPWWSSSAYGQPLTITTASLGVGQVGTSFAQTLSAAGGSPPYSWSVTNPTQLPNGLSLSASGLLSGTPTTSGTFLFTVQATDQATVTTAQPYSMTVTNSGGVSLREYIHLGTRVIAIENH